MAGIRNGTIIFSTGKSVELDEKQTAVKKEKALPETVKSALHDGGEKPSVKKDVDVNRLYRC